MFGKRNGSSFLGEEAASLLAGVVDKHGGVVSLPFVARAASLLDSWEASGAGAAHHFQVWWMNTGASFHCRSANERLGSIIFGRGSGFIVSVGAAFSWGVVSLLFGVQAAGAWHGMA